MVIKSTVYKNDLSRIEKERYFNYNCLTEDISIVFVLLNAAKSYIFLLLFIIILIVIWSNFYYMLNLFGIFRLTTETTTTHKLDNNNKFLTLILIKSLFLHNTIILIKPH